MPNRLIRDWTNSDKIDLLSFQAEVFFTRLIMKVDDFGCFWADEKRLRGNLFLLKLDSIREADISRWMAECQKAGLIVIYEQYGKRFLQILDFRQRKRQMQSKFPLPTVDGQLTDIGRPEVEEEEKGREPRARGIEESNLFRKPVIPTKHDVWKIFSAAGGTKAMAKSFYDKYEATGWFLNGSPVVSYQALAQRFIANWKSNDEKNETTGQTSPTLRTDV